VNRKGRRSLKKKHQATLHQYSLALTQITEEEYQKKTGRNFPKTVVSTFVSRYFFVQVHKDNDHTRISINRNKLSTAGNWEQNITWEELQDIKNQVGYAKHDCVEIFPMECDEVNVSNMRHLWVMPEPLPYAWRKAKIEEAKRKEAENANQNADNS